MQKQSEILAKLKSLPGLPSRAKTTDLNAICQCGSTTIASVQRQDESFLIVIVGLFIIRKLMVSLLSIPA